MSKEFPEGLIPVNTEESEESIENIFEKADEGEYESWEDWKEGQTKGNTEE